MDGWVGAVREVAGDVPVVIAGNKLDVVDFRDLDWSPLASTATRFSAPLLPTSAKTGDNVQVGFSMIARLGIARDMAGTRRPS
jgi:GTPase SAR1 family protein